MENLTVTTKTLLTIKLRENEERINLLNLCLRHQEMTQGEIYQQKREIELKLLLIENGYLNGLLKENTFNLVDFFNTDPLELLD
jgi:hypothetical protein